MRVREWFKNYLETVGTVYQTMYEIEYNDAMEKYKKWKNKKKNKNEGDVDGDGLDKPEKMESYEIQE